MSLPDPALRLLLIHGSRLNAAAWGPLEEELFGRVVCEHLDLPGHGHEPGPFTMAGALKVVSRAVQALDPQNNRIVLAGHSLGGYVAMQWAASHHGLIHGLVLMGSTAQPKGRGAGFYRAVGDAVRTGLADERWAEPLRDTEAAQLRRVIPPATAEAVTRRGSGLEAIPDAWDAVLEEADLASLTEVDAPIIAINGEYDQFRIGEAQALELRHDLQIVRIDGASHSAPMTHPAPVASAITAFLRSLP